MQPPKLAAAPCESSFDLRSSGPSLEARTARLSIGTQSNLAPVNVFKQLPSITTATDGRPASSRPILATTISVSPLMNISTCTPRGGYCLPSVASFGITGTSLPPIGHVSSLARSPSRQRPRCDCCSRKLKPAASYPCRCGHTFCPQHRYPEAHECVYDYKTEGRKALAAASPLIQAPKLPKI